MTVGGRAAWGIGLALVLGAVALAVALGPDRPGAARPSATAAGTRVFIPGVAKDTTAGNFVYIVQPGDTLFSIAQAHGTTVEVLVALNNLPDPDAIAAGQPLAIPIPPPAPPPIPVPGGPSVLVYTGSRSSNLVALTFDMGGRVEPAIAIMSWLIANNVPATIFMTGAMAENPWHDDGREVLRMMDQHPHLFSFGNHSYTHPDFRNLSIAQMQDEIWRTEAAVAPYTSKSMRPYFRPPYGGVNAHVLNGVGQAGYYYTVMWDIDTIDWLPPQDGGPTVQAMVNKVVTNAQGGTIVLMHLGGYNTYAALPAMVAGLRAKGLEPATLDQVIATLE
jgi:peptidoglycan/xylan/chitin deacetylase (PgdA/CDA1 family)